MTVRVRFAPAPTGQVHIGNIRAAIYNWLFARHEGGKFLLRIEDTDRERSTPEAVQAVMDSLEWLGLMPDEPPLYQTTRVQAHLDAAQSLLSKGLAYKEDKGGTGQGECIVFKMPGTDIAFTDLVKGKLAKQAKDLADFVIVRSDGSPVFHIANVVDDIFMGITHVIRGDDHVENTFRHIALFNALGAPTPSYAHLPMIVNAQGKPYSKRDGAAFVGEFRKMGYHPDTLVNHLSLLGWSPGDNRERLPREEIIRLFTLDRVKSGPSQMDLRKMTHFNGQYIAEMPFDEFFRLAREYAAACDWTAGIDEAMFSKVCVALQTRTKLFTDVAGWKYFFREDYTNDDKSVKKILGEPGTKAVLQALKSRLEASEFSAKGIETALRETERESGLGEGKLNQPLRIAVTGVPTGTGVCETVELLGRVKSLSRLTRAVDTLCA